MPSCRTCIYLVYHGKPGPGWWCGKNLEPTMPRYYCEDYMAQRGVESRYELKKRMQNNR